MLKTRKLQNHFLTAVGGTVIFLMGLCTNQAVYAQEADDVYVLLAKPVDDILLQRFIQQTFTEEPVSVSDLQSNEEVECLALNIYFEARSEPKRGQRAVGHVVMNRVANKHFPNTICDVVQQGGETRLNRCQFSWWCDGRSDKPVNQTAWEDSMELAHAIFTGDSTDPTNGALWYHAEYVQPYWKDSFTISVKIGQHVFYRNKTLPKYSMN
jgi:spore germination cell wall hydrolase CwlJ-like protein